MGVKKFEYIDSLRGLAILLVILVHVQILGEPSFSNMEFLSSFVDNGRLGVQLFFVASAFTLMLSFQNRVDEPNRDRNFFIRRFFRIAPLYYFMGIFMLFDNLLGWNIIDIPPVDASLSSKFFTHIFFVNSLSPTYIMSYIPGGWSISVEFLFYLVVPVICLNIRSLDSCIRLVVLSILFSVVLNKFLFGFIGDYDFRYYNPISQFPVFTIGFLAYYILNGKDRTIKPFTLALIVICIFVFCYVHLPYHILYSFVFGGLIIVLSKKAYKVVSNRVLADIGKVSFSMYITHFIIIYGLDKMNFNEMVGFDGSLLFFFAYYLLIILLTYGFSYVTYTFIEKPFQNLGRSIIKKLDA